MWKFTSDCNVCIFSLHLLIRGAIWVQCPMALDLLRWWHMSPSDQVQCTGSTRPNPDHLISMLPINVVLFMSKKMVLLFSFIVINDAWLINDINRSYMTGEKTIKKEPSIKQSQVCHSSCQICQYIESYSISHVILMEYYCKKKKKSLFFLAKCRARYVF